MTDFMEWCSDLMRYQEPEGLWSVVFVLLTLILMVVFTAYFAAVILTKGAALLLLPVALYILYRNDTRSKLND
jgi:uncharacterized membrane protein